MKSESPLSSRVRTTKYAAFLYSQAAHWIIIACGIFLRITQYLSNRSLTEGEAALALNIIERSYAALLQPLDYFQAAPVGFLFVQNAAENILGSSEYALRLFPLAAGIVALVLFYVMVKKTLTKEAIPIALILFAVGDHLIYFASEVKQYSSDVLFALIILLFCVTALRSKRAIYHFLYGIVGAITLWFSHPALFVFGAGALVLIVALVRGQKWRELILLCLGGVITIASLYMNYVTSLAAVSQTHELVDTWQQSLAPFPPTSLRDISWYGYVLLRMFKFPGGFSPYELYLAVVSFVFGVVCLYYRNKKILVVFLLSLLFTLVASALRVYPFEGRLLLFLTPLIILLTAQGMAYIQKKTSSGSPVVGIALVCILLIHPVANAAYRVFKPRAPEELRPALEYVDRHYQQDDVLYIYYASFNAYQYYKHQFGYEHNYSTGLEARDNWNRYYDELKRYTGNKRVWIIMSHVATWRGVDEEKLFVSYLDMLGKQEDAFLASGAAAYLYNLE